jgi:hypothetical protein
MLHFLRRLRELQPASGEAETNVWLAFPMRLCTLAAIALPWLLFEPVTGLAPAATLTAAELWSALWPMGIGVLAAFLLARVELPAIPPGDVLSLFARTGPGLGAWLGESIERLEVRTRSWPVAGTLFLLIAILFWASLTQFRS